MPVGIADKRRVVPRVVAGANPRRALVGAAGGERGGVKAIDLAARGGRERDVEAVPRESKGVAGQDREGRLAGESRRTVAGGARLVAETDMAERGEGGVVEGDRALEVGDADGDVVEHVVCSRSCAGAMPAIVGGSTSRGLEETPRGDEEITLEHALTVEPAR